MVVGHRNDFQPSVDPGCILSCPFGGGGVFSDIGYFLHTYGLINTLPPPLKSSLCREHSLPALSPADHSHVAPLNIHFLNLGDLLGLTKFTFPRASPMAHLFDRDPFYCCCWTLTFWKLLFYVLSGSLLLSGKWVNIGSPC